jgi:hypothetical protein
MKMPPTQSRLSLSVPGRMHARRHAEAAGGGDIEQLHCELSDRLARHPFDYCSAELLRALIATFDLAASPLPPPKFVRSPRLRVVRDGK